MEAFNAEANVRTQREAAYADRYVTVVPKGDLLGLRLDQGGELHYDDGSIVRLLPGDWVIEQPDGVLRRCSAATFLTSFEVQGKGVVDVDDQLKATRIQAGELKAPAQETPDPEPTVEDIKATVLRAHEEANARVATWAKAAYDGGLVTAEERDSFIATNEFPAGLTVTEADGEWLLTRGEGNEVGSLAPAEERQAKEEQPWKDRTVADIKTELQKRQVSYKATSPKGDLVELIEASDANIAMGGDGTLAPPPEHEIGKDDVAPGAETPDTAAKDPKLPDHGAELPGQTTFIEGDATAPEASPESDPAPEAG